MATCKDCIHKDVCYLIEHYGKDLCSDEACDKFLVTPVRHGKWIVEYDYEYETLTDGIKTKGKITYLKDSNNNIAYYDFKNIKSRRTRS